MSDILVDAREWLADAPVGERMGRTHDETCHRRHLECLVRRLVEEVERLREERRLREALWQACAKHTRLVYGNVFAPKPLPPGPETKEVGK